ncbi:MAG TPA: glycosyltransferase, partial [Longimicrobium sp.]|nr:glycosyltransferase [Longimicrobium sp.]
DALRRRAHQLGVGERVHWLGHRDDVPQVLAGCDIFVLSSRNEGMANVMLEAMAVGTPVIAADVGGVRTALGPAPGHPPAGWIVPAEDPGALSTTLRSVAALLRDDPDSARAPLDQALHRVEDRFGVERMLSEVERVLFDGPRFK